MAEPDSRDALLRRVQMLRQNGRYFVERACFDGVREWREASEHDFTREGKVLLELIERLTLLLPETQPTSP